MRARVSGQCSCHCPTPAQPQSWQRRTLDRGSISRSQRVRPRHRRQWCISASEGSEAESSISDLRDRLELAVRSEDYKAAAHLRDELQQRESDATTAVTEANRRFYSAFENGNMAEMESVWGRGEHVQVFHPGMACIAGREGVLESWRLITKNARSLKISLQDVRVYASGESGFVTCIEIIEAAEERGRTAATNVFERQDGRWVIVHHHGGQLQA